MMPGRMDPVQVRAFRELALVNWRELIRDPKSIFYIMIPPILIFAFFLLMQFTPDSRTLTVVVPEHAEPQVRQLVEVLKQNKVKLDVVDEQKGAELKQQGKYDAIVTLPVSLDGAVINVEAAPDAFVQVWQIEGLLAAATRKAGSPSVMVHAEGGNQLEPAKFAAPGTLIYMLASLAVFGIATPIVNMRQRGILRLLGSTPVSRLTFVLAQVPARLFLALAATILVLVAMAAKWDISATRTLAAFATAILGFWLLASIGYLVGGTFSSGEATTNFMAALLPFGLILSGVIMPLHSLPIAWLKVIPRFSPLAYLGDALRQILFSDEPMASLYVDFGVVVGTTIILTILAVRYFRWDSRGEPAPVFRAKQPTDRGL